ncbi:hypothetical protein JCM31826_21200 [Thermaurantimonas aggregans]|uniref:Uncharacterized protein n=1 Tax=Thermaurantimonas aggregans TaxID=2173829 RepID=A0A401XNN5_9FLAO|nr:hypothetical protein [Thermaurantimonas aggregans]MCX8147676.1 hypothetical protein [Thermaurantimonas aggregans]GCD78638.1 hypothetical protein JCM31826_21200 [Thermaurantimonas aggregans]
MKGILHRLLFALFAIGFVLTTSKCKQDPETALADVTVEVTAEGPLYEGSNTAVGIWKVDLAQLFPEIDFGKTKIKSARIEEVILDFDPSFKVKAAKVEISGRNVDMQKIAFANNIGENESSVKLLVAEEQKGIEKFLQLDAVNVVTDVDLAEDLETDFSAVVKFKISINY